MTSPTDHIAVHARLRRLGAMMIGSLIIEMLLGTANALWLKLPDPGSGWSSATPMWLVSLHMIWGLAILFLAIWIAVLAWRNKIAKWNLWNLAGIIGIIIAFAGGSSFLSEVSNNGASFTMAVGWAIAIGAYALALVSVD